MRTELGRGKAPPLCLEITPGFAVVLLCYAYFGSVRLLCVFLLAALLHEASHLLAAKWVGLEVAAIRLSALGAELIPKPGQMLSFPADLLVCFSGCAGNFFAVALCCALRSGPVFLGANLILGCFNCLPVRGLDGGNGLCAMLEWWLGPQPAERISAATSILFAAAVAVYGVSVALTDWRRPYIMMIGLWLLVSAPGLGKN